MVSMPFKRARVLQGAIRQKGKFTAEFMFQCPLSGQGYCRVSADSAERDQGDCFNAL